MEFYIKYLVVVLRSFAYVSMVLALMHAVHEFRAGQNVTKYIIYLICLTAFLAFYSPILDYGCAMFDQGVAEARQNTFAILDEIDDGITQKSFSFSAVWESYIVIPLTKGLLTGCKLFHWISRMVQKMFIVIYRVSAPLAIGLAAWRVFIPTGIRFAAGTLWLCTWSIGCAIADMVLLKVLVAILAKTVLTGTEGAAGAVASRVIIAGGVKVGMSAIFTATGWAILFALLIFLITAIMLYILVPIALYHIICAGDVVQGATHAMTGAIGGGMIANKVIHDNFAKNPNAGGTSGGPPAIALSSGSNGTSSGSGGGAVNSRANQSHIALAESQERQLNNKV